MDSRFSKEELRRQASRQGLGKLEEQFDIELLEKILKGLICPYCKQPTVFVDSEEVYQKSYGMIYLCRPCKAWVGIHKDSERAALGRIANAELREWKKKAHAAFDPIWKSNLMNRHNAYEWLSQQLKLPRHYTHIGFFGVDTCKRVVALCKKELE
jgi:uncharacterized protein YbaR (Trm112 family)